MDSSSKVHLSLQNMLVKGIITTESKSVSLGLRRLETFRGQVSLSLSEHTLTFTYG